MSDYNLTVPYCTGYVDYSKRQHVLCGKVRIGSEWVSMLDPFKYFVVYETCPTCTKKELVQIGIDESELEKILSTSG